jgi:hypothetical protein
MAHAFGEEKIANEFENVPLSKRTVTRMVEEIGSHISNKLRSVNYRFTLTFHWLWMNQLT